MVVWLINPYGPIPGEAWRDYSFAMMGDALAKAGHQVVWWTSTFAHHFKTQRTEGWEDRLIQPGFVVRLVPSPSYQRNIGLGRLWRDIVFARKCYQRGQSEPKPDVIVYYENPITLGYASFRLAQHHDSAVMFDQMDIWPELFENAFPAPIRPIVRLCLTPIYRNRKSTYENLTGVMALAQPYLDFPLGIAPGLRAKPHGVVYNGIDVAEFRRLMQEPLDLPNLPAKREGETWVVFAGTLGPSYDIPAILEAARQFHSEQAKIRFILAGDGPYRPLVEAASRELETLSYVGKMKPEKLCSLYKLCDIGLNAYSKKSNVEMPDKVYDYTAAGLPVVNSLTGEVSRVLKDHKAGLQYEAENAKSLKGLIGIVELKIRQDPTKAMTTVAAWKRCLYRTGHL
ncbi:MAG: glycosyltransferase family 4 protein, partial [Fimbriimonadaceae bacterium]|nr:glycosyltransferase family 4 protein [Fimbriimonadaceae bacterium]